MQRHPLKNGIPVYAIPVAGTETTTVLVMVQVGSRYEPQHLAGASHYIEHMMFKGSTRLPTPADVSRALDAIGADYNAYTGKEYTGYYVKCAAEHASFAAQTLYDMTFDALFQEAEFDRERGVIIEEINMYADTPMRHIGDLIEEAAFAGNTLGRDIAGSPETMRTMTRADVLAFRHAHYVPSRLRIAVAGQVSNEVLATLERTFGAVEGNDISPGYAPWQHESRSGAAARVQAKDTKQVQLALSFTTPIPHGHTSVPTARLLSTVLGGNMSSRLFMSVREQGGLAYRIRAEHSEYQDTGIFTVVAGLESTRVPEALERIAKEIRDVQQGGLTEEEVGRAKAYMAGHVAMAMEDSAQRAEWYAHQAMYGSIVETPEEHVAKLQAVTREQVEALAREVFACPVSAAMIGKGASEEVLVSLLPKWQ
jgi:predicted Zn-dependent peptidase